MSPEKPKLPADGCGATALLDLALGRRGIEEGLQVAIAQAVNGELAPMDGLQQGVIPGFERMQRATGLALEPNATLDGGGELLQGGAVIDGG